MEQKAKKMIYDICSELGIKCKLLSKDWIFMLEKDNKTRFLAGYKSSLNDHALGSVLDDKYALYDVLRAKGLQVCEYNIVYGNHVTEDYALGCNDFNYVKEYFNNHKQEIVLKPNDGTCGRDVYKITDLQDLEEKYNKLTKKHFSINMGPFYHIKNEYRFIVLNNEVKIAYCKNKPIVYGDGKKAVRELLREFNYNFFSTRLKEEEYNRVLNVGEVFEYNWKFNLSQGAIATEIRDKDLYNKLEKIALNAVKAIELKFGSVDIILTEEGKALILEMNSGVMVDNYIEQFSDGYNKAKQMYKEVIKEMFRK